MRLGARPVAGAKVGIGCPPGERPASPHGGDLLGAIGQGGMPGRSGVVAVGTADGLGFLAWRYGWRFTPRHGQGRIPTPASRPVGICAALDGPPVVFVQHRKAPFGGGAKLFRDGLGKGFNVWWLYLAFSEDRQQLGFVGRDGCAVLFDDGE